VFDDGVSMPTRRAVWPSGPDVNKAFMRLAFHSLQGAQMAFHLQTLSPDVVRVNIIVFFD
jgi:hypothetical protein